MIAYFHLCSEDPEAVIPEPAEIMHLITDDHVSSCFRRSLSVINQTFLDNTPSGSKIGTVRSTLANLVAVAISLRLEVSHRMITNEEAAAFLYGFDEITNSDAWNAPLDTLIGPAGSRRSRSRTPHVPKRVFNFLASGGTVIGVETGRPGGLQSNHL